MALTTSTEQLEELVHRWKQRVLEAMALHATADGWHRGLIGMYKAATEICVENLQFFIDRAKAEEMAEIERAIDELMARQQETHLSQLQQLLKEAEEEAERNTTRQK